MATVFLAFLGVSGYVWTSSSAEQTDPAIARTQEYYTCGECGHAFSLSVQAATDMFRAGTGVVCPSCSKPGAAKQDVKVYMGGYRSLGAAEQPAPQADAPEKPAAPVGGMKRPDE